MRTRFAPAVVLVLLLCLFMLGRVLAQPTTVVGDGTPASCTAVALAAAVAAGGEIAFPCGPAPVTITTGQLTIANGQTVVIDAGDLVTLSGGGANHHFRVQTGAARGREAGQPPGRAHGPLLLPALPVSDPDAAPDAGVGFTLAGGRQQAATERREIWT
jgi:hypothetical protein